MSGYLNAVKRGRRRQWDYANLEMETGDVTMKQTSLYLDPRTGDRYRSFDPMFNEVDRPEFKEQKMRTNEELLAGAYESRAHPRLEEPPETERPDWYDMEFQEHAAMHHGKKSNALDAHFDQIAAHAWYEHTRGFNNPKEVHMEHVYDLEDKVRWQGYDRILDRHDYRLARQHETLGHMEHKDQVASSIGDHVWSVKHKGIKTGGLNQDLGAALNHIAKDATVAARLLESLQNRKRQGLTSGQAMHGMTDLDAQKHKEDTTAWPVNPVKAKKKSNGFASRMATLDAVKSKRDNTQSMLADWSRQHPRAQGIGGSHVAAQMAARDRMYDPRMFQEAVLTPSQQRQFQAMKQRKPLAANDILGTVLDALHNKPEVIAQFAKTLNRGNGSARSIQNYLAGLMSTRDKQSEGLLEMSESMAAAVQRRRFNGRKPPGQVLSSQGDQRHTEAGNIFAQTLSEMLQQKQRSNPAFAMERRMRDGDVDYTRHKMEQGPQAAHSARFKSGGAGQGLPSLVTSALDHTVDGRQFETSGRLGSGRGLHFRPGSIGAVIQSALDAPKEKQETTAKFMEMSMGALGHGVLQGLAVTEPSVAYSISSMKPEAYTTLAEDIGAVIASTSVPGSAAGARAFAADTSTGDAVTYNPEVASALNELATTLQRKHGMGSMMQVMQTLGATLDASNFRTEIAHKLNDTIHRQQPSAMRDVASATRLGTVMEDKDRMPQEGVFTDEDRLGFRQQHQRSGDMLQTIHAAASSFQDKIREFNERKRAKQAATKVHQKKHSL